MKRSEAESKYKWDFSDLYKNHDEWKKDMKLLIETASELANFKGKLSDQDSFYKYLELDTKIDKMAAKLVTYLRMGDTDQTDESYQILEGTLSNEYQKVSEKISFVSPEIKEIGFDKIQKWLNEKPEFKNHEYGFKKFFEQEKHILSDDQEELLTKVSRSRGAINDMYDSLAYADRQEEQIIYNGETQILTGTLYSKIMEDSDPIKDQEFRVEASKLFVKNFKDKKHSFARIYEGILQSRYESVKLRDYESHLQSSLSSDSVSPDIYLKLLEVGKKYIKPFQDFNLLIKEKFALDKFYPTDSSLKLVQEYNKEFTVEEAKELIKDALSILGKEYLNNLDIAWSDNKIDFYEDTNKRDGAYSTGGSGVDPIILMNWDDKFSSVATLAHESGHSVHTLFADQNQPYPLNDYPIILAEVASTINEHILFDYMFNKSETKEEKIYLLQQRIGDLIGTFYRQIQFADFEYQASKLVEAGTPLTAQSLNDLFTEIQKQYGYEIFDKVKTEEKEKGSFGWPRISHFFHSPFYVYKYAIDVTASFKLYNDIKNGNIDTTLNFLKAGGHKEPMKIMVDAGIDFTKEETYMPLIDGIDRLVQQLKDLIK